MKRNQKWKIPQTLLEWRALCVHSYKNCKLKVKPWWVGASEKKRIFCNVYFVLRKVQSTFRIYILLHIKKYDLILFLLVDKIVKSIQCIFIKLIVIKKSRALMTKVLYDKRKFCHDKIKCSLSLQPEGEESKMPLRLSAPSRTFWYIKWRRTHKCDFSVFDRKYPFWENLVIKI